jgi:hypothetical protein
VADDGALLAVSWGAGKKKESVAGKTVPRSEASEGSFVGLTKGAKQNLQQERKKETGSLPACLSVCHKVMETRLNIT